MLIRWRAQSQRCYRGPAKPDRIIVGAPSGAICLDHKRVALDNPAITVGVRQGSRSCVNLGIIAPEGAPTGFLLAFRPSVQTSVNTLAEYQLAAFPYANTLRDTGIQLQYVVHGLDRAD